MPTTNTPMMLALPKNRQEELRMSIDTYKGRELFNLRIWFRSDEGEMRPTKKGVALRASSLPELIAALTKLQASIELKDKACI